MHGVGGRGFIRKPVDTSCRRKNNDAERRDVRSHAERGNEFPAGFAKIPRSLYLGRAYRLRDAMAFVLALSGGELIEGGIARATRRALRLASARAARSGPGHFAVRP